MKPTEEFRGLLATSHTVAHVVAKSLALEGHHVRVLPYTVTPNEAERHKHTDHGDLEIRMRVEVKHRPDIDFKTRDEFPWPSVIVDEAYKIDDPPPLPLYGYVIVNASMTAYLWIQAWTRLAWFKEQEFDRRDNQTHTFYKCPINAVCCKPIRTQP